MIFRIIGQMNTYGVCVCFCVLWCACVRARALFLLCLMVKKPAGFWQ